MILILVVTLIACGEGAAVRNKRQGPFMTPMTTRFPLMDLSYESGIEFCRSFWKTFSLGRKDSLEEVIMYKLTYFDMKGRAEVIRLLFVLAGVSFNDHRIQRSEWSSLKPSTPWGQLPVLEVDGKQLAQTVPILNYLGGKFGFAGKDPWQQALVSSVCEAVNEISLRQFMMGTEGQKAAAKVNFLETELPFRLRNFERFITKHGQNSHVIGNETTTADICLFHLMDQMAAFNVTDRAGLTEYPKVRQVIEMVESNDKIAAYLPTRKAF